MGYGPGDMIVGMLNPNANAQLGAAISPNPNPLGGPSAPATSGSATLPNAAVTKQDPTVANLATMLLDRQQRARAAEGINSGLDQMAASFGTAQQQASKRAALRGGGGGENPIGDVGDIMTIQKQVQDQNEYARFHSAASIAAVGQALRDHGVQITNEQTAALMDNENFRSNISQAFGSNVTTPQAVKEADASTESWKLANPNATPQDVAAYRSGIIAMGSGGNMKDIAYRNYAQDEIAHGRKPDDPITWENKHATQADIDRTHGVDVTKERDAAVIEYPAIDETLRRSEEAIQGLLANKDALLKAVRTPDVFQRGKWAANAPAFLTAATDTKAAAALLDQLNNALAGEALKGGKNVRNIQEFNALAGAYTAGLRPGNTDKGIIDTLTSLQARIDRMREVARDQAGLPPLNKDSGDEGGGGGGQPAPKIKTYNPKTGNIE